MTIAAVWLVLTLGLGSAHAVDASSEAPWFRITVVDRVTRRGVPLVELTTTNGIRHVTDSAGTIAFDEPGLMGREVWFSIGSHGYSVPKDGFGNAGMRLMPVRVPSLRSTERTSQSDSTDSPEVASIAIPSSLATRRRFASPF